MSQINELENLRECPTCNRKLPQYPPCPICGSEIENFLNRKQYSVILDYLLRHKGSQCRITLGKKDGNNILVYELLSKKQLKEES